MILTYPFSSIVAISLQITTPNKIQINYQLQHVQYLKHFNLSNVYEKPSSEDVFVFSPKYFMTDLPRVEPTAGINAGVSLCLVFPVSQHDVVSSKANLAGSIDGYNTTMVIHDFRLENLKRRLKSE